MSRQFEVGVLGIDSSNISIHQCVPPQFTKPHDRMSKGSNVHRCGCNASRFFGIMIALVLLLIDKTGNLGDLSQRKTPVE